MEQCSVNGCDAQTHSRGMCGKHYQAWRRHGDPTVKAHAPTGAGTVCDVDGCEKIVKARGYCIVHYTRWLRYDDPTRALRGPEAPVPTEKRCVDCRQVKPIEDFSASGAKSKGGKSSYCRPCAAVRMARWRAANPDLTQAAQRRHNEKRKPARPGVRRARSYNFPAAAYEAMLESQGGVCAICGGPPCGRGKELHVDHDHGCCPGVGSCGKCIRGLLCGNCNTMLGLAKEDPERLLSGAQYLRKYK